MPSKVVTCRTYVHIYTNVYPKAKNMLCRMFLFLGQSEAIVVIVISKLCSLHIFSSFIDRGEFGEVYQGTATDILGPETGQTPVAVKVCLVHT